MIRLEDLAPADRHLARVPMTNGNRDPGLFRGYVRPGRTSAAQVTFHQHETRYERNGDIVDHWRAWLLEPETIDTEHAIGSSVSAYRRAYTIACITEIKTPGGETRVYGTMQASGVGSRRHFAAETVTEAQERIIKWAGRRFRVPADGARVEDLLG